MTEDEKIRDMKKKAESYAECRFDTGWEQLLSEDCLPWQREAVELAFKMGFFEGVGYAGRMLNEAVDERQE